MLQVVHCPCDLALSDVDRGALAKFWRTLRQPKQLLFRTARRDPVGEVAPQSEPRQLYNPDLAHDIHEAASDTLGMSPARSVVISDDVNLLAPNEMFIEV